MASQVSPQSTEQNDTSRILLPSISEVELLNQPPPPSRGSMPKTPSKQRIRVNSEPSVPNAYVVKNSSVKSKDAVDDAAGKGKMPSNHKKVSRRGSVPAGVSKEKDCNQGNTKTTKGSKNVKRQVKRSAPSPDVIDLSNEDVVHELMMRLYETLGVPDNNTCHSSLREQNDCIVEESCKQTKPNGSRKTDNGINLFRHRTTRFPQVSKTTSNLEVFYSKPTSWKSLMTSRQLQPRIRAKNFLAFREQSTKADQPVNEKPIQMNYSHLTWSFKKNSTYAGRSTSVLRKRGLSAPFIVTNDSAFVSSEMFKTSFESRKSVTFAE